MDKRMVGYIISRSENEEADEKGLVSVPVSITEAKLFYSQIVGV